MKPSADLSFTDLLKIIYRHETLTEEQAMAVMNLILSGVPAPEQIGAFLAALHFRGVVAEELTGFVRCLREKAVKVSVPQPHDILDVCGTGGDGLGTFNVSTCVALVVASLGQKVAKHGNRAVSSRCGSFDLLEELGIAFDTTPEQAQKSLEQFGICFLFAPAFHPILKAVGPLRRQLGVKTVFNALGPLLNPVGVGRQLIGVYSNKLLRPVATTLQKLGASEALIVCGENGEDEISLTAPTQAIHLKNGILKEYVLRAPSPPYSEISEFSEISKASKNTPPVNIQGGDATANAKILYSILKGEPGAPRAMTLFNAGAALWIANKAESIADGITLAAHAVDKGLALELLYKLQQQKRPTPTQASPL